MTSPAQLKRIHAMRRAIPNYTETDYRDLLASLFGVTSTKMLSELKAKTIIAELAKLAGPNNFGRRASATATGKFAKPLQALWIAAYNLGIVRERDDRAMLKFVERQTGIEHTRFLVDAAEAAKAIEGLKAWIAREAKLEWPKSNDAIARKHVVLAAQARIMKGRLPTFDLAVFARLEAFGDLAGLGASQLDDLSGKLGRRIRGDGQQTKWRAA